MTNRARRTRTAPDEGERALIRGALDRTLFVEAGAGSGKTSTLVDRVVALVTSGQTELERIAAITFTEKAAAELRDRIRGRLQDLVGDGAEGGPAALAAEGAAAVARKALDQLDRAPIGTLHSFAQRILSEHPIEARLPPRVEVLDEVSSGIEFEQRWSAFSARMLEEPALERTLLLLLAGGVRESAARDLALAFEANWDLVERQVPADADEPADLETRLVPVFAMVDALGALTTHCRHGDDALLARIGHIQEYAARIRAAGSEIEMLEVLVRDLPGTRVGTTGRKDNWAGHIEVVRNAVVAFGQALDRARRDVLEGCAIRLGSAVRAFTVGSVAGRRADGRLSFHDLLVLARAVLSDPVHGPEVRQSLAKRYDHLLLDEFQDTDPIQIDLAVRMAAADPASLRGDEAWSDIAVRPGALFMVGDPKQSIYRFRRADIATFLAAQDKFSEGAVALSTNFRTVDPAIGWINRIFGYLFALTPDTPAAPRSQPVYEPLLAYRTEVPPVGPAVSRVGGPVVTEARRADDLRRAEAEGVARAVSRIIDEGWSVSDPEPAGPSRSRSTGWRPARLGDIAILVPARTSLPFLEDALDDRAIPFRAESSSLVYASRAVRDLLMVLRALDDPTDELKIVAALRTPLFGCGDDDLWRYRSELGGRWDYTRPQPHSVPEDDIVRTGLDALAALHRERHWLAPSEVMDRVVRERRAMELGHAAGRERDVWRRIRFVIDQARAWSEATHGTLRQYLRWVDLQAKESARLSEPILPESDHDAVRIMTVHTAKGLEFPITVLSGMSTEPRRRGAAVEVVFRPDGRVGYKLGRDVTTNEFDEQIPIDEQMSSDERIRLMYVAATRARDHLVVSLYRKARSAQAGAAGMTNAELLIRAMGDVPGQLPEAAPGQTEQFRLPFPTGMAAPGPSRLDPWTEWESELKAIRGRTERPATVAATALSDDGAPDPAMDAPVPLAGPADELDGLEDGQPGPDPGLQKRPRDMDLPPWLKGRYGTSVGRAVHGVLQTVEVAASAADRSAVAAQCEAEGIPDQEDLVVNLVEQALSAPSVVAAARSAHWREVYVCVPAEGGRLLEGYVDLLYRSPHGLVVVDYKTASDSRPAELDRRTAGYRMQGAAYALAVGAATGETVCQVVFVYLTPSGAVEQPMTDIPGAITELRQRIADHREVVVDQS